MMNAYTDAMTLEVRHLRLVQAVADTGSLTQAGHVLHLTQSALSHQLRDVEDRLGTPLFLRIGKRLALTPAGARLLESARDVLAQLARTEDALRQLAGDRRGVLRFTTECYTCYHWLPPLLRRYRAAHPGVDLRIDVTATNAPIRALLAGQLEAAIVTDPVRDRRIVTRPLFSDELVAVVSPDHPFARRAYVEARDFESVTLLAYSAPEDNTLHQKLLRPAGVTPAAHLQVGITEAIIELAKAGMGVGVLAQWAVAPHVRAGTLRTARITRGGFTRAWKAATLKDLARVPYVVEFIDLLAAEVSLATGAGRARARRDAGAATRGTPRRSGALAAAG
jgi:LysR family transcriptional regulator for metE and metH